MFVVRGRASGPPAAVTAGVHGDEYEGVAAVGDLTNALDPVTLRGTLILVPVANPTAFAAGTRTNPEDGANLARSFPGDPDGTPTERLAAKLFTAVGGNVATTAYLHCDACDTSQPLAADTAAARSAAATVTEYRWKSATATHRGR